MVYMDTDPSTTPATPYLDLSGLPVQVVRSIQQLVDSIREELPTEEPVPPRPPLRGRFADLMLSVPAEAIDEARREAWAAFPREFPEANEP
jgi:hypothetical protein